MIKAQQEEIIGDYDQSHQLLENLEDHFLISLFFISFSSQFYPILLELFGPGKEDVRRIPLPNLMPSLC